MNVLFMGLRICLARFVPIFITNLLNVFAVSIITAVIYSLHYNDFENVSCVRVLERTVFIVPIF